MGGAPAKHGCTARPATQEKAPQQLAAHLQRISVIRHIVALGPKIQHIVLSGWGGEGLQPLCKQAQPGRQAGGTGTREQVRAASSRVQRSLELQPAAACGPGLRTAVADAAPVEAAAGRQRARERRQRRRLLRAARGGAAVERDSCTGRGSRSQGVRGAWRQGTAPAYVGRGVRTATHARAGLPTSTATSATTAQAPAATSSRR